MTMRPFSRLENEQKFCANIGELTFMHVPKQTLGGT